VIAHFTHLALCNVSKSIAVTRDDQAGNGPAISDFLVSGGILALLTVHTGSGPGIHFLKGTFLVSRIRKPHKDDKEHATCHEEEECPRTVSVNHKELERRDNGVRRVEGSLQSFVLIEFGEELLEDHVCDTLRLGAHSNSYTPR
jgi:hypothetical protein